MRARVVASLFVAGGVLAPLACLEPTQVMLQLTSRDCSSFDRVELSIGGASVDPVVVERPAIAAAKCAQPGGGLLGTLVVRPGAAKQIRVRATAQRAGPGCAADPTSCIVATRTVSFATHRALELPISLDPECFGVMCPMGQTCKAVSEGGRTVGRCMGEQVECASNKCDTPVDGGVVADAQPPPDAAADAPVAMCPSLAPKLALPLVARWSFDGAVGSKQVTEELSQEVTQLLFGTLAPEHADAACQTSLDVGAGADDLASMALDGATTFAVSFHAFVAGKGDSGPLVQRLAVNKGFSSGWSLELYGDQLLHLGYCASSCADVASVAFEAGAWHSVLLEVGPKTTVLTVDNTTNWPPLEMPLPNPGVPLRVGPITGTGRVDDLRAYR